MLESITWIYDQVSRTLYKYTVQNLKILEFQYNFLEKLVRKKLGPCHESSTVDRLL